MTQTIFFQPQNPLFGKEKHSNLRNRIKHFFLLNKLITYTLVDQIESRLASNGDISFLHTPKPQKWWNFFWIDEKFKFLPVIIFFSRIKNITTCLLMRKFKHLWSNLKQTLKLIYTLFVCL